MNHYKSNLNDIIFNLFEVNNLSKILEHKEFKDLDDVVVKNLLTEASIYSEQVLANEFSYGDKNPPNFDLENFSVKIPEKYKKIILDLKKTNWHSIGIPENLNGLYTPKLVLWANAEFLLGAQPAAYFYMAGAPFSRILFDEGTGLQKKWAETIAERQWGATMVLTEPDAGSDVGASKTKAIPQPDGSWHIEGVKRFITSGDTDDIFENIFHLVLARPENAQSGTKGLSLFFVPKFHFDFEKKEIGERNGVFATNLEEKMGAKASITTELTFGLNGRPAKGWLVGDVHNGIAQMFKVIEYSRMTVGIKSIAALSSGYLNALNYAKTRIQGSKISDFAEKNAKKTAIINHPDIRRSLLVQKSYAEGMRALYLFGASFQDAVSSKTLYNIDFNLASKINDFLLPVIKGVGSEQAFEKLTESLQIFGGSGYLQDYPIEQYLRDTKVDSVYEGTTAIQSLDLIFRKIIKDNFVSINFIFTLIEEFIDKNKINSQSVKEFQIFVKAFEKYKLALKKITEYVFKSGENSKELEKVGLVSKDFLLMTGDILIAWLLWKQATISENMLNTNSGLLSIEFYKSKIETAKFFSSRFLPLLEAKYEIISNINNDIMDISEDLL